MIVKCKFCTERRTVQPYRNSSEISGFCEKHLIELRQREKKERREAVPITKTPPSVEPVKFGGFKHKKSA